MDRATLFVSAAIGGALALFLGPRVGTWYYGPFEPAAALRGTAAVGVVGVVVSYFAIRRVRLNTAIGMIFGVIAAAYYGQAAGYRWFFCHNDLQANIYGMPVVFMLGTILGELIAWPIVRNVTNVLVTRFYKGRDRWTGFGRSKTPALAQPDPEALWASIENGLELTYEGRMDRDVNYFHEGRNRKERIRMKFSLRRDTMAMTPRERAAYYVLLMLQRAGLDDATADRLLFALTWGNGACRANWTKVTCDHRVMQQLGRSGTDIIAYEAAQINANVDGAISELYTMLRTWAASRNASQELKDLQESMANPAPLPRRTPAAWA